MIENLEYTDVPGSKTDPAITVYALSTCGFCKRAMSYLESNRFAYRYVYVDKIALDTKTQVKKELKELYKADIAFPFVTMGQKAYLVGFIEADWKRTLGL
ncbi:MAG: glutaredoxin family protein [Spirochaetales bacterium]|nr:MAG: glutaredoxin family protein [Spirochaetales bacterium]